MTFETVKEHLERRPFVPFTVHVSDGDKLGIRSPEYAYLHPRQRYLLIAPSDVNELQFDRFVSLDSIAQIVTNEGFAVATGQ
jgi:hypothetical protein